MRDSLFSSAVRAFLIALGGILGIGVAILLVALASALFTSASPDYTLLPNHRGEESDSSRSNPVILQIDIEGVIGLSSPSNLTGETIEKQLLDSQKGELHGRIKGILLHIDSPGGTTIDSWRIYQAIKTYKQRYNVPVVAFADGLCASGGYYIACAADQIYASDASIIGSVGVIMQFFNVSGTLDDFGVEARALTEGLAKDAMNPFRPWAENEDAEFKALGKYFYTQFVDVVTAARPKLAREQLINVYGARVFPAPQSASYGYIDAAGYLRADALRELIQKAGLKESDTYQVISVPSTSFWSDLFEAKSFLKTGQVKHTFALPTPVPLDLMNQWLYM